MGQWEKFGLGQLAVSRQPQSHQWNLNRANSTVGMLDGGMIGEFKDGHGDFYGTDTFNGRHILVRNGFS